MDFAEVLSSNLALTIICGLVILIFFCQIGHLSALWCRKNRFQLKNKHVFITGGSLGLGRALAVEFASQGARVTIMARKLQALQEAKEFILSSCKPSLQGKSSPSQRLVDGSDPQSLFTVSADVTNEAQVQQAIEDAERALGPVDVLVTCAGAAATGHMMSFTGADHRKSMDLNYFGTLNAVRAVTPKMIARRSGHIVLVSSGMALTAYTGYTTYAPTKFAIRGLGEALRSELLPYNIRLYQAYPPNFQSPGYEQENLTKPADAKAIEEGEPLHTAEDVAACLVDSVRKGEYHISCGNLGINLLTRIGVGMSPRNNTLMDALLSPLLVLVSKIYTSMWDSAVLRVRAHEVAAAFGAGASVPKTNNASINSQEHKQR